MPAKISNVNTITSKLSGYEEKESKGNSKGGIDFE